MAAEMVDDQTLFVHAIRQKRNLKAQADIAESGIGSRCEPDFTAPVHPVRILAGQNGRILSDVKTGTGRGVLGREENCNQDNDKKALFQ